MLATASLPAALTSSPDMFNQMFVGNPMYPAALIWGEHNYVDVGDVAAVHTEALVVREACGQRFVIASLEGALKLVISLKLSIGSSCRTYSMAVKA